MSRDASFWVGLAHARLGSGALITDSEGRVLMVEPTYKPTWEIPGGAVESGETSLETCRRECREELGIDIRVGRLLVIDHQTDPLPRGDSVMFVYDGGTLDSTAELVLPEDELRSSRFVALEELDALTTERLARRVRFALEARAKNAVIELANGAPRDWSEISSSET